VLARARGSRQQLDLVAVALVHKCTYTCTVTFRWDPGKARANLVKHRIDFADATAAFDDPHALTREDAHPREQRFVTLGMDALGRLIVVC